MVALNAGFWLLFAATWIVLLSWRAWRRMHTRSEPWAGWSIVLGGEMEGRYAYLHEVFDGNAEIIDGFLVGEPGAQRDERRKPIAWGLTALAGFVEIAQDRLDEWRLLSAIVEAEAPARLPELSEADFRLGAVRRLALLAPLRSYLHGERAFAGRVGFLHAGFGLVGEAGAALAARVPHDTALRVGDHARVVAHDFRALSRESLASARVLLAALERSSS